MFSSDHNFFKAKAISIKDILVGLMIECRLDNLEVLAFHLKKVLPSFTHCRYQILTIKEYLQMSGISFNLVMLLFRLLLFINKKLIII